MRVLFGTQSHQMRGLWRRVCPKRDIRFKTRRACVSLRPDIDPAGSLVTLYAVYWRGEIYSSDILVGLIAGSLCRLLSKRILLPLC